MTTAAVTSTPSAASSPAPQVRPPARSALRRASAASWYHVAMIVAAVVWLLPMLWMTSLALSDNAALTRETQFLIPRDITLDNLLGVFSVGLTSRWFLNSAVVSIVTTVLTVLLCAMAGYAFARIDFRGKAVVYASVLAGLMIPKEAMFVPLFTMVADVQMHNTYAALILPRIAAPLGVFLMTQFFSKVPHEVEEAARIDGAGPWRTFFFIMLPLARPAMIALAIFTFVQTWNDYLWPLVSATRSEMFTITTGLASLQGNFAQATELGSLMARGLVGSLPLLIIFLLFQRHLIRGISMTSGGK
ncbi:carbohydrate ABC transporter permease [Microbacterium sp. zg.Y1090]|uniref:carbohydrate ABC transporter permease n=1 Tax=Microbacterium TaxID=33882 RepID=UPI00214B20B2|nr:MULTISPECIES: carbohydrate ABC transporter permease [unclassified Microbacterium]MCR2813669.1 carbohydrate ABC transporter permease [Microbacterium sp. zg.Y1084]MCR2817998.1 carbohydrate ABC transporter permease [Microbacterium sp. zg.Y1090]MDL5488084.1 carbohydrate ABC transporter permease [Microbacterium sp. zg-Y1211]WIM27840.1 carbohydrate ABC transporter permease [Microbacterium sp. zg-Y1090]